MSPQWSALTAACIFIGANVGTPYSSRASKPPECQALPIKPIQCVRGSVIDISGALVLHAKVSILQSEKELATMTTAADGKFSFNSLEPGDYVIHVEANHLRSLQTSIKVVRSSGKCKEALQVVLGIGVECDTGLAVVKADQLR